MLSFTKFLNYLNDNPNYLKDEQKDSLHRILFCNPDNIFIDSRKLAKELSYGKSYAKDILISLAEYTGCELKVNCSCCGYDNGYKLDFCSKCGEQLEVTDDNLSLKVDGMLDDDSKIENTEETVREEQLQQMITVWEQQRYIVYLLIDISNSEAIQYKNNDNYKKYLEMLRSMIQDTLYSLNGNYLCFGEIGDCFKLGLSDTDDFIPFISKLAETHWKNYKQNIYPPVVQGLEPYPCLKISAQLVELDIYDNPKDLLFKTLNGALDFNSDLLTKLFRLDGEIKPDYAKAFKNDNKISVWIFDKLIKKLNIEANSTTIKAGKHENLMSVADVIALSFPEGKMTIEDKPENLFREK